MNTKTFNRYNYITGAVDGTLAYDFSQPAYYPEEVYETPQPTDTREKTRSAGRERAAARVRQGFSPLAMIGVACVVVLLVMTLLAQIQLMNISQQAADLEAQITALESEHDKLTVEYEAAFNLKEVEEYARDVLGMQEPREDQIYYLSNVSSADRAVVISNKGTDIVSAGLEDILSSLKAYFH